MKDDQRTRIATQCSAEYLQRMKSWVDERSILQRLHRNCVRDRTGSHRPQRANPPSHSFRTNAPVGIHMRPDPTNPGSCHEKKMMSALPRRWWRLRGRKKTYKLYPRNETMTVVPLGTGNSVYTFPEVPTIGFVRGRTSSCIGARAVSTRGG